jgi:hypothetical protein
MRWRVVFFLVAGPVVAATGCCSPRGDRVEAELRARDNDLRVLRAELERSDAYNHYLERELRNTQHTAASPVPGDAPPPPSRIKSITLGRQTGGYEEDGIPGDEALQVVLQPIDIDGHTIKAPGTVEVTALEVQPEGIKKPLSSWHITADQLRHRWQSGLLTTGYFLILPWKNWPTNCKLRVVVQFISEENRLFEADRDVTIRLAPAMYRKPAPPPEDNKLMPLVPPREGETPPVPPKEDDTLPPPRKLEPEKKDEKKDDKKDEKKDDKKDDRKDAPKDEKKDEKDLPPPPLPEGPTPSDDPTRPLKGAVLLLKPAVANDEDQ